MRGATPRSTPSTRTFAPAGCDSTCSCRFLACSRTRGVARLAAGSGDVHHARDATATQFENVRTDRHRQSRRCLTVVLTVDEDRYAGGIRLHDERAHCGAGVRRCSMKFANAPPMATTTSASVARTALRIFSSSRGNAHFAGASARVTAVPQVPAGRRDRPVQRQAPHRRMYSEVCRLNGASGLNSCDASNSGGAEAAGWCAAGADFTVRSAAAINSVISRAVVPGPADAAAPAHVSTGAGRGRRDRRVGGGSGRCRCCGRWRWRSRLGRQHFEDGRIRSRQSSRRRSCTGRRRGRHRVRGPARHERGRPWRPGVGGGSRTAAM